METKEFPFRRSGKGQGTSGHRAVRDPLLCYRALGNRAAHKAAVDACIQLEPALVQQHVQMHAELVQDMENLQSVLQLHYKIKEVVVRSDSSHEQNVPPEHDFHKLWDAFVRWTVPDSVFRIGDADLQFLRCSTYGEDVARITFDWLRGLVWPPDDLGPLNKKPGISWVELAASWMVTNRRFLPVLRSDALGSKYVLLVGNDSDAREHGLSYTEAGTSLMKLIERLAGLIPEPIWPSFARGKTPALYYLGAPRFHQGVQQFPVKLRPLRYWNQS